MKLSKLSIFATALLAVFLSGCASVRVGPERTINLGTRSITVAGLDGFRPSAATLPNPSAPNVFVINGKMVIDQEPVRPIVQTPDGGYLVSWALDFGGGYSFPSNTAITFGTGAPAGWACGLGPIKKAIGCYIPKPAMLPASWKYSITITNDTTGTPQTLDPSMSID